MKHRAVIKGNVYRKVYYFGRIRDELYPFYYAPEREIHEDVEPLYEDVLWDGELDLPLLKESEDIYIDELNLTVKIKSRLRSTTGEYLYSTYHRSDVIEDEGTQESLAKAEEDKTEYQEYLKRNEEYQNTKKRNWFHKLFN